MNRRLTTFLLIASFAFLLSTLLQPWLFPPPKKPAQENPQAEKQAAAEQPGEKSGDPASEKSAGDTAQQASASPTQATDQPPPEKPPRVLFPNRLISLGKLGADSADKLVVTLNSKGAGVHRIVLNARTRKGNLRYRDLDTFSGYLGVIDLVEASGGVELVSLADGSPLQRAGIQKGDIVERLGDVPIVSVQDWIDQLAKTHPAQIVDVTFSRPDSGQTGQTVRVTTDVKPLELTSPHSGVKYDPDAKIPDSFLVTLRKKMGRTWPALDPKLTSVDWESEVLDLNGVRVAQFSYTLDESDLALVEMSGPIRIIKRFWLPQATANDDFDANFHLNLEIIVQNLGSKTETATFEIEGPTGTNIEGWWYQNKIHGRSSAIGQVAGARDIVGSSAQKPFVFWGGPEIIKNYLSKAPELQEVFGKSAERAEDKDMNFIGVDTQYFAAVLLPSNNRPGEASSSENPAVFRPYSAFVHVLEKRSEIGQNRKEQRTADITFRLFSDEFEIPPSDKSSAASGLASDAAGYQQSFKIFAGPKDPQLLQKYQLDDLVTYGWFAAFSKPLVWLLGVFYSIVGNYGIAIVLLTVLVRLLLLPISRKAQMNAARHAKIMQLLQPEIAKIKERYKDNFEKMGRAQRELFAKYKYNPLSMFGGCLLMFLQLPIFIGLYRGLSVDIALRGQPLIPGLEWCSNLAGPDQLFYWKDWVPFGLGSETGMLGPYFNLLPLATVALFVLQTKLFSPPATDDQQRMTQRVMTFTMAFMGLLFFKVPSGLCLYFITSSIWGIVERQLFAKPQLPENLLALGGASGDKPARRPVSESAELLSNDAERENRRRRDRDRQRRLKETQ